jgi:thioredoxin reductase (NADPH)
MGAAVYAGRFDMKTLVIGELPGGTITLTHLVENYPGFPSLSGLELAQHFQKHVGTVGVEMKPDTITGITRANGKSCFEITTQSGSNYRSKTILLATGTQHKKLGVKGETELTNKGVSYCATCDGPLFRDKEMVMVGGGDSAVKESLLLAKYGTKVTIVYRGEKVRPEPINLRRMEQTPNIEVINKSYKLLAKQAHPDLGGDLEKFKEINNAHKMLKRELC